MGVWMSLVKGPNRQELGCFKTASVLNRKEIDDLIIFFILFLNWECPSKEKRTEIGCLPVLPPFWQLLWRKPSAPTRTRPQ